MFGCGVLGFGQWSNPWLDLFGCWVTGEVLKLLDYSGQLVSRYFKSWLACLVMGGGGVTGQVLKLLVFCQWSSGYINPWLDLFGCGVTDMFGCEASC